MRFDVISLFPEMLESMLGQGVTGRALTRGQAKLRLWNPREYTCDVHRTVDDRPYGGGPGMVMKSEPLSLAIQDAKRLVPDSRVIYMSPQGKKIDQQAIETLSQVSGLIILAGRYEGVDERLIDDCVDEEWSIGDYVLSGGELPALVLMDAIIRLLPGVLNTPESAEQDSFSTGLLDHPHYTRPEVVLGTKVPNVLLSGDHAKIRLWRLEQSLQRTWLRRPDLLEKADLTDEETNLLEQIIAAERGID